MRNRYVRIIGFLLLLVFIQRSCVNMLVHTSLHNHTGQTDNHSFSKDLSSFQKECHCIDDFMLPFVPAEGIAILLHASVYAEYTVKERHFILRSNQFSYALRGPPAYIASSLS